MLARLIEWCGLHKGVVVAVALVAVFGGVMAARDVPLDAVPDLSDTQVIVFSEWMGRSPTLVEDQVTYPITTSFLGAPRVKAVRGFTMFGMSFVYVIFEDGTDLYWARSRTIEYLSKLQGRLPAGVTPQIGPDATGVGWVFEYALVDRSGKHDLAELRSFQDWTLRYSLTSVPGVAEVASIGGYEKQYQVTVDPVRLQAYGLAVRDVISAIRMSNADVGGRTIEFAEHEYVVRGRGYLRGVADLEKVVLRADHGGTPVRLSEVAKVQLGGNIRRGFAELDGEGEVAGGIVVMRYGENALEVIDRVKARIAELRPTFPEGVELVPTYDRSGLIRDSVRTLADALWQEGAIIALMIVVFLLHFRSSLVAILMLPAAVALAFIPMRWMGLTSNIMSLAGIIIAIGDMVDAAVVLVENAHKRLEKAGPGADRVKEVLTAAKELGPSIFGSLLVITVSFLPIFALEAQEGRLFRPLAYTKTFSMAFAALLSITLVPALMVYFIRGKIRPEAKNPINRVLIAAYRPALGFVLRWQVGIPRGRRRRARTLGPRVPRPGLRVHAAPRRGDAPLHAGQRSGDLHRGGAARRRDAGSDPARLPGGRARVRQGRPRRHADRPRAALHGRDRRHVEAPRRVAARHDDRAARAEMSAAVETPGFQGAWTMPDEGPRGHAVDRHPDAHGDQGVRARPRGDREDRRAPRVDPARRPRDAQRLRRARDGWLLPRLPAGPRGDRAVRAQRDRRARGGRDRDRRHGRRSHDRGARAVHGERALSARPAEARSRRSVACWCRRWAVVRCRSRSSGVSSP